MWTVNRDETLKALLRKVFTVFLGPPGSTMTEEDRIISEEIGKLKTLRVVDHHVWIDPSEVVTDKYIRERKEAANLLSR